MPTWSAVSLTDLTTDARILWRLLRGQPRCGSHAERLQAFYSPQAKNYDAFRARLLHGRQELIDRLALAPGSHVVELGCGTGSSLDFIGSRLAQLSQMDMVDLCPALLELACQRAANHHRVNIIEADATEWQPDGPVDCVFMSYALTMIPQWEKVIANAHRMLSPGGQIGVVDFHLPVDGMRAVNAAWKTWFGHDGVHLSDEHLPALKRTFPEYSCSDHRAPVPYLPGIKAPFYLFIGKRQTTVPEETVGNSCSHHSGIALNTAVCK